MKVGKVGLHNFTVGVSKERWCKLYMELPSNHPIVRAFSQLGFVSTEECSLQKDALHPTVQPIEEFTCYPYSEHGPYSLPLLRWKLFSTTNPESENLPPTRGTIIPCIQRTNSVCRVHKSYTTTHPNLPALTENGWKENEKTKRITPIYCLMPPAPTDIMELVKWQCKTKCSTKLCTCLKNTVPCTCTDDCCHQS